ncbi:hypothetical protein GCM10010275_45070 [Streptomyces litmocidini]|nr:hypothetical protein GCM10010275_45070 [Streptomyces litmocidini]
MPGASPLALAPAGAATGAATVLLGLRGAGAVATPVGAAAIAGLVGATLAGSRLGAPTGDWWAGVLGPTVLADGSAFAALATLLGKPGSGLGAALTALLGNAFSGMSSAGAAATGVGALGRWVPPGAGGSALRSVSAFDGAAAGRPLLVLSLRAVAGPAASAGRRPPSPRASSVRRRRARGDGRRCRSGAVRQERSRPGAARRAN